MRILVNDYAGHPFQFELSAELSSQGHRVTHSYCSTLVTPQTNFDDDRVIVEAISTDRMFAKYHLGRRIVDELKYGWRSMRVAQRTRPERVIASNVPLLSLLLITLWCMAARTRLVLWLQDVQSGLIEKVAGRGAAAKLSRALEGWLIRRAWRVVTISDGFKDQVVRMGAQPSRVSVIENWAPLEQIPIRPRDNQWALANDITKSFVFLYSGSLGMKHNPQMLLALADGFADDPDVRIVVVSEGVGATWLADELSKRERPNLLMRPFQPFTRLPDVLGAADVLLVLLARDTGMFSVPSKTMSYLCAARPILAAIPGENAAAQLVEERAKAGVVVAPGDDAAFVDAAKALMKSAALRDRQGRGTRVFAEATFNRSAIAARFLRILEP